MSMHMFIVLYAIYRVSSVCLLCGLTNNRTGQHRAVHDRTGPCFLLILVYYQCLLTEI